MSGFGSGWPERKFCQASWKAAAREGPRLVALLPTNGLKIRPQINKQVVMNAWEAAKLTSILKLDLGIPHHYTFTGGWFADHVITKGDRNPHHYAEASKHLARRPPYGSSSPARRWCSDDRGRTGLLAASRHTRPGRIGRQGLSRHGGEDDRLPSGSSGKWLDNERSSQGCLARRRSR